MKFGSLFTGIGGFDIGLEESGMECTWQVEIDDSCNKLLENKFPNVKRIRDIRTATDLDTVNLVCGGFPCQDLSVAGKRTGLAGERSGLWFEFHRIVTEVKPRWVVIENVPGLLSSNNGRDFAVILRGLVECGYGVAWRVLDARYFGVAQRRRRVYIVASLGNGRAAEILFEPEGVSRDSAESREAGQEVTRIAGTLPANGGGIDRPTGNANELDFCIPDSVAYSVRTSANKTQWDGSNNLVAFQQNTRDEVRLMNGDGQIVGVLAAEPGAKQQNYIARCQTSRNERIDAETENLIAFAWQQGVSENDRSYPVRAGNYSGSVSNSRVDAISSPSIGVRRLTPVECERLQGFPDNWTKGFSDSTRYKMLGNAQCVNVSRWLGKRVMENDDG